MTAARAFIHHNGYAMWWDGILTDDGDLFAYNTFDHNQPVVRLVRTADRNVIKVEVS